jgi:hypothetical protein
MLSGFPYCGFHRLPNVSFRFLSAFLCGFVLAASTLPARAAVWSDLSSAPPMMGSAAARASDRNDVPAVVRSLTGQHGPDNPALLGPKDDSVVGTVGLGRSDLNYLVTGDFAVLGLKLQGWY